MRSPAKSSPAISSSTTSERAITLAERGRWVMNPISPMTSPGCSRATVATLVDVTDVTNAVATPRHSTNTLVLASPSRQINSPAVYRRERAQLRTSSRAASSRPANSGARLNTMLRRQPRSVIGRYQEVRGMLRRSRGRGNHGRWAALVPPEIRL